MSTLFLIMNLIESRRLLHFWHNFSIIYNLNDSGKKGLYETILFKKMLNMLIVLNMVNMLNLLNMVNICWISLEEPELKCWLMSALDCLKHERVPSEDLTWLTFLECEILYVLWDQQQCTRSSHTESIFTGFTNWFESNRKHIQGLCGMNGRGNSWYHQ